MSWTEVIAAPAVATAVAGARLVRRIEHRATVGSTQDEAFALDADGGVLVIADRQRAGRGRHGRGWQDGPAIGASLSASIVVADRPAALGAVPLAVGLAALDAARAAIAGGAAAATLALRWPNDVLIGAPVGSKCAGVLVERRRRDDGSAVLVVGIGIDVDWRADPTGAGRGWTSLAEAARSDVDRVALVATLVSALDARLGLDATAVVAAHRAVSASLGRDVTVTGPDGTRVHGRAHAIADDGALMVEVDGELRAVRVGDVRAPDDGRAGGLDD
jgi:BirA family biotin operon repressor/biotin-[acetyl-CoA-carboxylase] ligase